ncbi:MAG: hypothetical protein KAS35_02860, partial [Candidatus Marinimicrobia bacterium]|nr:hypothetical protein [Candidatus Neomarinimicrobiota bacterium]
MRIFKVLIILFFAVHLFGQSTKIVIDEIDTLAVRTYDEVNTKLVSLLFNSDNIGEYFKLSKIKSDSLITYNKESVNVTLDTLIFRNNYGIRISVLRQIFKPLIGSNPIVNTTKIFKAIINSTPFIKENSEIYFGINKKYQVGAIVEVKSNFNNYFSGLIGASRSDEQKWTINGQMDIHIENQWKTASIVDLHWKRLDEESQILNLKYE